MIFVPSVALHHLMMAAGGGLLAAAAIIVAAIWLKNRGTDTDL